MSLLFIHSKFDFFLTPPPLFAQCHSFYWFFKIFPYLTMLFSGKDSKVCYKGDFCQTDNMIVGLITKVSNKETLLLRRKRRYLVCDRIHGKSNDKWLNVYCISASKFILYQGLRFGSIEGVPKKMFLWEMGEVRILFEYIISLHG